MRFVTALVCGMGLIWRFAGSAAGQEVMVSPSSVIFEGRIRSAEVIVANATETTSTFRIEPTYFSMREDGTLVEMQEKQRGDSAVAMLRYSPRQFQLGPGESQIVRLAVRKPSSLAPGEYRAHLRITNLGAVQRQPSAPGKSQDFFAQIKIRVSRAIRIVVRHGVSSTESKLGALRAKNIGGGKVELSFRLEKPGSTSSRGEYVLFARDRQSGATVEKFIHRGVIVYSEVPSRRVAHIIPASKLKKGVQLCVAYRNTAGTTKRKSTTQCIDAMR